MALKSEICLNLKQEKKNLKFQHAFFLKKKITNNKNFFPSFLIKKKKSLIWDTFRSNIQFPVGTQRSRGKMFFEKFAKSIARGGTLAHAANQSARYTRIPCDSILIRSYVGFQVTRRKSHDKSRGGRRGCVSCGSRVARKYIRGAISAMNSRHVGAACGKTWNNTRAYGYDEPCLPLLW